MGLLAPTDVTIFDRATEEVRQEAPRTASFLTTIHQKQRVQQKTLRVADIVQRATPARTHRNVGHRQQCIVQLHR